MNENKYKTLVNNSIILAIGNFGSKLINFFMISLYTIYMTTEEYGKGDIILTTVYLLVPVVTLSVFDGVLRYVIDDQEHKETLFFNALVIVLIGNILSVIVFLLAIKLFSFDNQIEYKYFFFLLFIQSLQNLFSQYVKAINKLKPYAINGILVSIGTFIFGLYFLKYLQLHLAGYIYSMFLANLFSLCYLVYHMDFHMIVKNAVFDKEKSKEMIRYSIPLIPNTIMWWVSTAAGRYVLAYYYDYQLTGIYAAANKIPSLLFVVTSIFMQAWQLSAIDAYGTKEEQPFFKNVYRDFVGVISIVTSVILLCVQLLTSIMLSNEFAQAWKYIPILLLANLFSSTASFIATNYIISKKTSAIIRTSVFSALLTLVFSFILVPKYGGNGASVASLVGFLFMHIARSFDSKKLMGWRFEQRQLIVSVVLISLQIVIVFNTSGSLKILLELVILIGLCYFNRQIFHKIKGLLIKS